ncbi:MAG: hypothetical protein IMZ62_12955 [Chloroflexi bacterium]|nr:hypothetical protein [Chloroflexota bacterium]MBE3118187.1 hypothetical protein [Candidatus Atribacteria bacterium]
MAKHWTRKEIEEQTCPACLVMIAEELLAENTRLREMVEAAYREGMFHGCHGRLWAESTAKAELDALDNPKAETGSEK